MKIHTHTPSRNHIRIAQQRGAMLKTSIRDVHIIRRNRSRSLLPPILYATIRINGRRLFNKIQICFRIAFIRHNVLSIRLNGTRWLVVCSWVCIPHHTRHDIGFLPFRALCCMARMIRKACRRPAAFGSCTMDIMFVIHSFRVFAMRHLIHSMVVLSNFRYSRCICQPIQLSVCVWRIASAYKASCKNLRYKLGRYRLLHLLRIKC